MPEQFQKGFNPPTQFQDKPGSEADLKGPHPLPDYLPTPDGNAQKYKAAGKLKSRKALITGGDSGIGRATAVLFAMEGADVFFQHLPEEAKDAQDTKSMVEQHGVKCHVASYDLRERANCEALIAQAMETMGAINILVLNHGSQNTIDSIDDLPEEQWVTTFNTNVHPFFYLAKYAKPHLKAGDSIIMDASINCYIGRPDLLDYTSTKGALVAFTRALSNQLISKGIRVNAVAPGPVWTPLVPATMGKSQQEHFNSPMGRPIQPSEIATCFVFLASPDSSCISGQTIHANGGVVVNG